MNLGTPFTDPFFTPFGGAMDTYSLPDRFTFVVDSIPHPLCLLAAETLQHYLATQDEWQQHFGLSNGTDKAVVGKMFGVLLVKTQQNEIGYLAAFSGKLAGGNHHAKFVPPVFDLLTEDGFLTRGMAELKRMHLKIKDTEDMDQKESEELDLLKTTRKNYSADLQKEIFEHYHFLNQAAEEKSLNEIFKNTSFKNPPSGAGECAAPKLLQYAFQHKMKPLAIAEFWWGRSPTSKFRKHGNFYPCCRDKCEPILAHMLHDIDDI